MTIKDKAVFGIIQVLRKHLADINCEDFRNRSEINRLADKQRVIKKKRHEITKIINELEKCMRSKVDK